MPPRPGLAHKVPLKLAKVPLSKLKVTLCRQLSSAELPLPGGGGRVLSSWDPRSPFPARLRNCGRGCEFGTGTRGSPASLHKAGLPALPHPPDVIISFSSLPSEVRCVRPPFSAASLGSQTGLQAPLMPSIHLSIREPQAGCKDPHGLRGTLERGWRGVPNTRLTRKPGKRTVMDAAPTGRSTSSFTMHGGYKGLEIIPFRFINKQKTFSVLVCPGMRGAGHGDGLRAGILVQPSRFPTSADSRGLPTAS